MDASAYPPTVASLLPAALSAIAAHGTSGPVKVLEVGCGEGAFAKAVCKEMAARYPAVQFTYKAIDPFPGAVDKASSGEVTSNLSFAQSDLLSFSEGTYDVVIMVRSLHHVFPLDAGIKHAHSLLNSRGTLLADEFAREAASQEAANFLFQRIDLLRVAVPPQARQEGGHSHSHGGHGGHGGHSHGSHEKEHDHDVEPPKAGGHSHSHGGHSHGSGGHGHSHSSEAPVSAPEETPSNLSYVHGTNSHVGTRDDGLPREGTPDMEPLVRWQRVIKHDPPLPSSVEMIAGLKAVFGEDNVKVEKGLPALYLMASMRLVPEVAKEVARVVHRQESEALARGEFEGIGMVFTATKA